jgi:hypothetical protein
MSDHHVRCAVSLVVTGTLGAGAGYGLTAVREALQRREVAFEEVGGLEHARGTELLVVGQGAAATVVALLELEGVTPPSAPEALLIHPASWGNRSAWVAAGADDRGLMYALLEIADCIRWAPDPAHPLSEVRLAAERPEVRVRSLSMYTMHKADFERRLHDPAYWARYLDMLARSRFNTFALLFAYESAGYLAPPYPYFFAVPGFPGVHVPDVPPAAQARNLDALNRLVAMAHARGLDFTLGIWDHIYRGGVQSGGVREGEGEAALGWRVRGVTQDNLVTYSVAALRTLLQRVPNLDALQFRMHGESGLTREEMDVFWAQIYDVIVTHAPDLRFDARAKGFPDHLIDLALEKGVNIRICTKYWMEQMGLPFHPTHVHPQNQHDRRHGYANLLRYPRRYSVLWRLWNGGTARVLLWGDPDYVRRFVASTHLYDGDGFDVNEPLATKMAAHDHDAEPFELLNPPYRFYDWEFERYWHFFQLFGRLGYNPETPSEVWMRDFERRFGAEAAPLVADGLHLASRVLPMMVAYTYPYHLFPTTRGWVEKERMADLPSYAAALPSDTQQFLSIAEAAQNRINGETSAKRHPYTSAAWFDRIAGAILKLVASAEAAVGGARGPEFVSTMTDLRILAHLARYHARRAHAGVAYALYEQSRDLNALDAAIAHEEEAITAWCRLVEAAGDVYAGDLKMGLAEAGLSGHWRDELVALRKGLGELAAERDGYRSPAPDDELWLAHVPVRRHAPGADLVVRATAGGAALQDVQLCYARSGTVTCFPMKAAGPWRFAATLPGDAVQSGLSYYVAASDGEGAAIRYPDEGEIAVTVTQDTTPPAVIHTPVTTAPAGEPLAIRARVQDAAGVAWVRLRYRSVTQYEAYRTLAMAPTGDPATSGVYEAVIPGEHVDPRWDLLYFIEAMDEVGCGCIYPDLEVEAPYVVVKLVRSKEENR